MFRHDYKVRCKWVLTRVCTSGDNIFKAFRHIFKFMLTRIYSSHLKLFKEWENVWFPCAKKATMAFEVRHFQPLNIFFHMGDTFYSYPRKFCQSMKGLWWNIDFCLMPWIPAIISTYQWKTKDKQDQCLMLHSTSVAEFIPVCSLKPQIYILYIWNIYIQISF